MALQLVGKKEKYITLKEAEEIVLEFSRREEERIVRGSGVAEPKGLLHGEPYANVTEDVLEVSNISNEEVERLRALFLKQWTGPKAKLEIVPFRDYMTVKDYELALRVAEAARFVFLGLGVYFAFGG